MNSPARRHAAFTLIELLVVIAVIGIVAGIALPVFASVQTSGRKVQSLSNMRQLGAALMNYAGQNNGQFPTEGESAPTWASAAQATDANSTSWYNALPRSGGFPAVADYAQNPASFYTKANLLYVSAATYPATKLTAPLFAVTYCSKFFQAGVDASAVRLTNFQAPARTVVFQEAGLPGEKKIYSAQSSYNGQTKTYASRAIARYTGRTLVVFADGHADSLAGADIVDPASGKAYAPQSLGKVSWTMNPDDDANK